MTLRFRITTKSDRHSNMIFAWTPDLIDAAISGLSDQQLAALDLAASITGAAKPGAVRLNRFGFQNLDEYEVALANARAQVRAFFGVRGIRHVADLDFQEPGRSVEGRIRESALRGRVTI